MRKKDQERRKTVEDRRRRMLELEEERRASLLRRSQARESRIDTMRSSRMPARMAMSCTFGTGEAAAAAFSRPRVAFGSSTPREICMPLVVEPFPAMLLNGGSGGSGRSFSVYHAGCLLSAHGRSHRRAASAPSGSRSAARLRRDLRTGYQPPRLSPGQSAGSRPGRRTDSAPSQPAHNSVTHLTPNRGARSASRGGTTPDSASRRVATGTRSASVTPSSSFVAERPGQVEKALRRGGRSADRRPAPAKSTTPTGDGSSGDVKLRSRSQANDRHATPNRPRPTSQVVTPAELDSVFARLAQPKKNLAAQTPDSESSRPSSSSTKKTTPTAAAASGGGKTPAPSARSSSTPRPTQPKRRLPSPPRPPASAETRKGGPTSAASVDSGLSPSPQPTEKELESELELPASVEPQSELSQDVEPQSEMSQVTTHELEPISQMSQGQETSDSEEEPVAFEPIPSIMTQSMPAAVLAASTKDMTEDEYRVRIAEQRRLAREKMERERQQKEEEEAARREQERLRREQARQMAEDARRRMEEEEERQRLEEIEAQKREEERLRQEEEERKEREAEEARQKEQAEKERLERIQKEEEERQARRARLEKIMSRVKRTDETPSPPVPQQPVEEEPEARGASPEVRGQSPSPAEAPKFKSALLQSMLGGGGLRRASGSAVNLAQSALGSQEAMNSATPTETSVPAGKPDGMPHSFSMDALASTPRREKEVSLPNGDGDEDVDGPALLSASIHTRLEEAKANSGRGLETDDSRTAFEEILNLPPSTGAVDRHLSAPVDPLPGVWFEQPAAPPREPVMTDLLS